MNYESVRFSPSESDKPFSDEQKGVWSGLNALSRDGFETLRLVGDGEKPRATALVIHSSLLWQFPTEVKLAGVHNSFKRVMEFQKLAIWINEYTDIGISAELARSRENGEEFSALLGMQNTLRRKVDEEASQYAMNHGQENIDFIAAFRNDAALLSRNRHLTSTKLSLSEYLDLDSAIHEVAFTEAVAPDILSKTNINPKASCLTAEDLKEKYKVYLTDPDKMDTINPSENKLARLHAISMLLKFKDDEIDITGISNTDRLLDIPTFSTMTKEERSLARIRYKKLAKETLSMKAATDFALSLFERRTNRKIKETFDNNPHDPEGDVYSAESIVNRISYTTMLRHLLYFRGDLGKLFSQSHSAS